MATIVDLELESTLLYHSQELPQWKVGMFEGAKSFNSQISACDISSVTIANAMFEDATLFNQNLCAWRDDFPYNPDYTDFQYNVVNDMFNGTSCTIKDPPREDTKGPFCASDCSTSPEIVSIHVC